MKVKKYQIVAAGSNEVLGTRVTEMLNNGWELYGNPFSDSYIDEGHNETWLCQAMVLPDTEENLFPKVS